MTKVLWVEVVPLAEEAQLANTTRRVDATQLATTFAEKIDYTPHSHRPNVVRDVLFKG
ncbi:hypothetical protein HAX54_023517, partial [Datura stramonium]|nr:hypothetical protein [Datura stramonium]